MAYNYRKLRGRIIEKFCTQAAFASAMGVSERTMSFKLNNIVNFDQDEIEKACELLEVPVEELHAYFFTVDSQSN